MEPRYMVASQLNILMAEGMDTLKVMAEKRAFISGDWPEVNM